MKYTFGIGYVYVYVCWNETSITCAFVNTATDMH